MTFFRVCRLGGLPTVALLAALAMAPRDATAQQLDLTQGGPVEVTASDGIEWRQQEQVVIARGSARAVRGGVTLTADRLIARYRPRAGAPAAAASGAQGDTPMSGGEIWRLEAEGNVRIDSATDHAEGDRAVYDMDQAVMVLTGRALKLTTPQNVLTSRDSMEYWPGKRMAVARGAAVVVTADQRRIAADTLVGYFREQGAAVASNARPAPAPAAAQPARNPVTGQPATPGQGSQLDRVEAFGNVEIRTTGEVVRGDRGVYSETTGMSRLLGGVRITRGDNQLNGQEAIVNMRTGVARLVATPGQRVQGLIIPQQGQQALQPQQTTPSQQQNQGGARSR
ncbi:LptA/OstA family protein [Roseomonas sp. 18066]|uniref:LptA/OstA family protein n=1 Tax=Roseomonas sp. 18066 TaxID=2681412 RepID=UPI00135A11F4|nr:LptA/OstA family protein [Roseomonas sp. 18066]